MKTNLLKGALIMLMMTCIFSGTLLQAQTLKINPKTSSMTIAGTTNVHDFETKVTQISGELVLNSAKKVESLKVIIPVKGIKSKERLMDEKTYDAFDSEKNPNITFQLTEASALKITGQTVEVTVTGNLTMAGATRKISFKVTGTNTKNGTYEFKGSLPIKMSDYKMKAPTAMMGMMKVGDAVTLKYTITLDGGQLN